MQHLNIELDQGLQEIVYISVVRLVSFFWEIWFTREHCFSHGNYVNGNFFLILKFISDILKVHDLFQVMCFKTTFLHIFNRYIQFHIWKDNFIKWPGFFSLKIHHVRWNTHTQKKHKKNTHNNNKNKQKGIFHSKFN